MYVPESIKTECPQETTKQARKYAKYTESMIIIDRAFHYVSFTCIFSTHIMIIQCHSCLKALIYIHNLALLPSHKWNHSHTTLLCSLEFELVTSPCNACRGGGTDTTTTLFTPTILLRMHLVCLQPTSTMHHLFGDFDDQVYTLTSSFQSTDNLPCLLSGSSA